METDAPMEIRKERGFPPGLEKASPTTLGFFTVPTGPTIIINSKLLTQPSSGVTYDSRKYFKNILRVPGLRYVLNASPYGRRTQDYAAARATELIHQGGVPNRMIKGGPVPVDKNTYA